MRPTFSILLFTVLSGAGYGLWFLSGCGLVLAWPEAGAWNDAGGPLQWVYPGVDAYALVAGGVLVSVGLVSSLAHLGQPQRAWRALSQWRTSWLSREGVAALLTYLPALALLGCWLGHWLHERAVPAWQRHQPWPEYWTLHTIGDALAALRPLGALLAFGALATVFCTAHIYASLKPIRAWCNPHVVPAYLLLALYSGALWLWALTMLPGGELALRPILIGTIVVLGIACAILKISYWRAIDRMPALGAGHAIGLETLGTVRSFEQPHTEENYLTHEMGFVLARKHSRKLRAGTIVLGFLAPVGFVLSGLLVPLLGGIGAWLALIAGMSGLFIERWLFFAEARHAVMAYYAR